MNKIRALFRFISLWGGVISFVVWGIYQIDKGLVKFFIAQGGSGSDYPIRRSSDGWNFTVSAVIPDLIVGWICIIVVTVALIYTFRDKKTKGDG